MRELRGFADEFDDGLPQCPTHEQYWEVLGADDPKGHHGTSCQYAQNWELQRKRAPGATATRRRNCESCLQRTHANLFVSLSRLYRLSITHVNEHEYGIARGRDEYLPHEREAILLIASEGQRLDTQEQKRKQDGH